MNRKGFFGCLYGAVLIAVAVLSGCAEVEMARPAEVTPVAGVRVTFDSFVNVGYPRNRSMPGFQTTRDAIEATLELWYESTSVGQAVVDGTLAELQQFLRNLPDAEECDISVVYLGSVQDAAGTLEFIDGQAANWRGLLRAATPAVHPCRIVILDACHAAAVRTIPAWSEHLAAVTLLAAGVDEKTYQFAPVKLSPISVQKHYPLAQGWAQRHLEPQWNRHISFLGLMWAETAANTTAPPPDKAGWSRFFDACSQTATIFRESKSRRWGSSVQTMKSF